MSRIWFRDMGIADANRNFPPFTTTRGTSLGPGGGSTTFTQLGFTVDQFTIVAPVAPGGGNQVNCQMNENITAVGGAVTLSGAATNVRGTMGASIVTGLQYTTHETTVGSPATAETHNGLSYACASPNQNVSFYYAKPTAVVFGGGSPRFIRPIFGNLGGSESAAQITWPISCNFKFFQLFDDAAPGTGMFDGLVKFLLRINGATALTIQPANGITFANDNSTVIAVNAGDLVCWEADQNGGTWNDRIEIVWGMQG
jgi:hypothetical protein